MARRASLLDLPSRLGQGLDQRQSLAAQPLARQLAAGHVGKDLDQLVVGQVVDLRAEEDLGGPPGRRQALVAVDQSSQFFGQTPLAVASLRLLAAQAIQVLDLLVLQIGQHPQAASRVFVGDVDPVLVEGVGTGTLGGQPERALFGLAHLAAVRLGQQRAGHAVQLHASHPPPQIDSRW
jgi:hypothetical protein